MTFFFFSSSIMDFGTKKSTTDSQPLANKKKTKSPKKERDANYWYTVCIYTAAL